MADWFIVFLKGVCCGTAAIGFGILFNTPVRVLVFIGIGGVLAGLVKFTCLGVGSDIIVATFAASFTVGLLCIPITLVRPIPPQIFCIPCVIPLVPGTFAYKTMLGFIKLSGAIGDDYLTLVAETLRNGILTLSLVMAIAIGLVAPIIVLEKYFERGSFVKRKKA